MGAAESFKNKLSRDSPIGELYANFVRRGFDRSREVIECSIYFEKRSSIPARY